ncbi:MAG: hypothetical protein ABI742_09860 [Gemmatimonadota bacterium]
MLVDSILHAIRPGQGNLAGASVLSLRAIQDSAQAMPIHPADSTVDKTLLGDKITPIIQWIFQKQPWVMWTGAVLAAIVALVILGWLWLHRQAVLHWLTSRSSTVKFALVATAFVAVLVAAGLGYKSYEFVEKDKRFCNGCHIFVGTGQAWVQADTGNYTLVPRLEGKHDSLSCHTCHPLKPMKEAVKMVLWMSGIRDERIPPHARVERKTCERCHVQGAAKETWQAIAATAGHRAHLESDSSALKGKVECLTCHARTAHRFVPADSTCVQKGCHLTDETEIQLGKMAGQTDLHCIVCHQFTKPVAALATRDSAAGSLRPSMKQCFSCHDMKQLIPDFSVGADPHNGSCGMCHNPHKQKVAADTRTSCTAAGCHADWRKVPFHTGAQHRGKAEQCTLCHQPHAARVDASDCTGCHTAVRDRTGSRLKVPLPFDTLKALNQSLAPLREVPDFERPSKVKGDPPPGGDPPGRASSARPALPSDTFSHTRHKKLACLTCHVTSSGQSITFEAPRGCQICHHQAPLRSDCKTCHASDDFPSANAVSVSIAAAGKPARVRTVGFGHAAHADLTCTTCHTQAVTLAPVDSAATCQGCHAQHHEAGRDCAACHRTPAIAPAHARPVQAHIACDACHATAKVASLVPTRSFCLACHEQAVDHYGPRECSECHLQAHPEEYRPRLLRAGVRG